MTSLHIASAHEDARTASTKLRLIIVRRPPALCLLPRRRMRPASLATSVFLHAIAMAALLWLPRVFAGPVILAQEHFSKSDPDPVILNEPLILPSLPRVEDRAPSPGKRKIDAAAGATLAAAPASVPPRTPDYTAPQTIVSDIASPVNRIQTILRPDMVAPPNLKFPLRLQSVVILPSTAAPVLAPRPPEQSSQPAPVFSPEEAPAIKTTVQTPVLTLAAKKGSVIRASTAPSQTVSPDLKTLPGTNTNVMKALVVVNAVQVAPDPSIAVPEGQLAGKFAIGPSAGGPGTGSSPASSETGNVTGAAGGHSPAPGNGHSSMPGGENTAADRSGSGVNISPNPGNGEGIGATNGGASGAGAGSARGGTPGISISGGVPGRRAVTANSFPGRPSYPLMIISGGASGGASRDLGIFGRSETVYSVSIPMADSGGGPDWTMQYALLDAAQAGAGLLVPPIAQKKIAANMKPAAISVDSGPVFISAIIDENGKLQALKPVRAQDARSQAAIRALEQWEFLPAQLDGKAVASKILVGVAVHLQQ
jgi:Gram-negative bacterial TonB protein C-terminal